MDSYREYYLDRILSGERSKRPIRCRITVSYASLCSSIDRHFGATTVPIFGGDTGRDSSMSHLPAHYVKIFVGEGGGPSARRDSNTEAE